MGFLSKIGQIAGTILGGPKVGAAVGGLFEDDASDINKQNYNAQKEFAQMGIRWKVADAKAAGISPLFALGAPPTSFSPSFIQGDGASAVSDLASMGQDISRAVNTGSTTAERAGSILEGLQLRNMELQNEGLEVRNAYMASQLAKINQAGMTPPFPTIGEPGAEIKPSEVITGSIGSGARQPGAITDYQFSAPDASGNVGIVPSKDMKERIEDDIIAETLWHARNRLFAPRHPDPDMYWNPFTQNYRRNPIPRRFRVLP